MTLVECKLETGRTHQIRVHMQHIGHPLFGDPIYGGNVAVKGAPGGKYNAFLRNMFEALPRQALHAKTLGFTHPGTGERMTLSLSCPRTWPRPLAKWTTYIEASGSVGQCPAVQSLFRRSTSKGLFPEVDAVLHLFLDRVVGVGQFGHFGAVRGIDFGHGGVQFFLLGLELAMAFS